MPLSALLFEACSKGPDKCDSVAMEFLTQTYHNPGGECLLGQLTDRGKLGMITLGKRLRERYIDKLGLLPPFLDNLAPISLRSTDYARTLESSQYLMAGLYPLETRNPNLILEYHIADQDSEWLFPSPACKRLEELSAQFTRQVRRELRPEIEAVKRKFPEHFPYDKKDRKRPSSYALHDLFDLNAILRANGLPMVPGFGEADFATVDRIVTESWFRVSRPSLTNR